MKGYKIRQNEYTKDTVSAFGKEAKVLNRMGKYLLMSNNFVLFVDHKTNTLFRVPMSMIS